MASANPRLSLAGNGILEDKIGYQLRMADRVMSRDFVKDVGMTRVQYGVMSMVASCDGLSQVDIGESLEMDRATTMAVVNKLVAAGLVERRPSKVDGRMHALQLTTNGRRLYPSINRKVLEHEGRFQRRLSRAEQASLFSCLWKIRNG